MTSFELDPLEWLDGGMPFSSRFGDHFYARNDGRAECSHVFMGGNGLPERWQQAERPFVIGELGFGTGLNFLETWRQWIKLRQPGQELHFVSFEAYPMESEAMRRAITAWPDLLPLLDGLDAHWPSLTTNPQGWKMDEQTQLTVVVAPALEGVSAWPGKADAWYLDGFAPARNPEMWSLELMQAMADRTAPGGRFASYTAAGWVRRNLQAAGFIVRKAPGYGGKRDMICGELAAPSAP